MNLLGSDQDGEPIQNVVVAVELQIVLALEDPSQERIMEADEAFAVASVGS